MTNTPRRRNTVEFGPKGHSTRFNNPEEHSRCVQDSFVKDVVCKPPESGKPFSTSVHKSFGGYLNFDFGDGRIASNFTPLLLRHPNGTLGSHLPFVSRPTDSALATALISRASPEATSFSVPLFLFELRELPKLFSQAKELIVSPRPRSSYQSSLGSIWLQAQFGWKPFISDLWSMISLADSINKRALQYKKIIQQKGKTIKRNLYKGESSSRSVFLVNSLYYWIEADLTTKSLCHVDGYARYMPKHSLPSTDKAAIDFAKSTFLGLNLRPADLWDAFPWSWMIDYFLNVGDFIASHQGNIYFDLVEYALMESNTSIQEGSYIGTMNDYSSGPIKVIYRTKERFVPPLSLDVNFETPFLTAYQSSILGSLLLTR